MEKENNNLNINDLRNKNGNKINFSLIIIAILVASLLFFGIFIGINFLGQNNETIYLNNVYNNIIENNNVDTLSNIVGNNDTDTSGVNNYNNEIDFKENNKFFSISDIITCENNYFEYYNYEWDIPFGDIDGVSIWNGTIKNITDKNLKANLRLKFYDLNNNVIGDIQRYNLYYEVDSSDIFVLEPGEESKISFTFYSNELNEGFSLEDVKFISVEDIK